MTLHRLADRRAAAAVPEARLSDDEAALAPDPEEVTEWKLLADRVGHVLDDLETAANPRDDGNLPALLDQIAGLRTALDAAIDRRIAVAAIIAATRKRAEEESAD